MGSLGEVWDGDRSQWFVTQFEPKLNRFAAVVPRHINQQSAACLLPSADQKAILQFVWQVVSHDCLFQAAIIIRDQQRKADAAAAWAAFRGRSRGRGSAVKIRGRGRPSNASKLRVHDKAPDQLPLAAFMQVADPPDLTPPPSASDVLALDIAAFRAACDAIPRTICSCCDHCFLDHDGSMHARNGRELERLRLTPLLSPDEPRVFVCKRCWADIGRPRMPAFCLLNGLDVGVPFPALCHLRKMERQMIARLLLCQNISILPKGGQRSAKGLSVLLPNHTPEIVNELPRPLDNSDTIIIELPDKPGDIAMLVTASARFPVRSSANSLC